VQELVSSCFIFIFIFIAGIIFAGMLVPRAAIGVGFEIRGAAIAVACLGCSPLPAVVRWARFVSFYSVSFEWWSTGLPGCISYHHDPNFPLVRHLLPRRFPNARSNTVCDHQSFQEIAVLLLLGPRTQRSEIGHVRHARLLLLRNYSDISVLICHALAFHFFSNVVPSLCE